MSEVLFKPASKRQAMFLQSDADIIVFGGAAGCLRADAEFLTPKGWKSISKYSENDEVAVWDSETDSVHFEKPIEYIKLPCDKFTRMKARCLDFILTDEHRVPYFNEHDLKKPKVITWAEVKERHLKSKIKGWTGKIKTGFSYSGKGVDLNEGELRLQVAVQADGRIVKEGANNYTQMRFAKRRKYERLKWILDTWNLPYKDNGRKNSDQYKTGESFEVIVFPKYADKIFDEKYYQATKEQLEIIEDEVGYWDGHIYESGQINYSTTKKENADFIQFVFHALGHNTSFGVRKAYENNSELYSVDRVTKGKGFRSFVGKGYKQEIEDVPSLDGFKYCFSVSTSYFLCRQNNNVFITGNSGKTFCSLMRFMRWIHDPKFFGYVFRKNATDMKGGGGAFDEAVSMFTAYDPSTESTKQPMQIKFRNGASLSFIGMDGDAGKKAIHGKQISAAMVDEATHLSQDEIEWIISRLRTQAKEIDGTPMKPSIWLTCNPQPDTYIHNLIKDYYLYPKGTVINGEEVGGRPIPERNGDYRYYLKLGNDMVWGETYEELFNTYQSIFPKNPTTGESTCKPMKFQFIGATCYDNPPLLEADPTYISKLLSLGRVDRERLLMGSWEAREEAGGHFKREWTPIINSIDEDKIVQRVRCFDLASSVPTEANPYPDWTVGVLMAKTVDGRYIIEDVQRFQKRAGEVEMAVIDIVRKDKEYYKGNYKAYLPQDPASAGQISRKYWAKMFAEQGIPIYFIKSGTHGSKLKRFEPFSASSENGLIEVLKADWNNAFFSELEGFDGKRSNSSKKDDQVDPTSDCFNILATKKELPKLNARKLRMS